MHLVKESQLVTTDQWRTPMGDTQDRAIPYSMPAQMRVLWFQCRPELGAQS